MEVLILSHAPHEGPGLLAEVLSDHGATLRTISLPDEPHAPLELGEAQLVLVLGGPISANDDLAHPWLAREAEFLGRTAREGAKVLALCLGSQILARGLGATVRRGASPEIGFLPIDLNDEGKDDPVLAGLRSPEIVFHWHRDTYDLPPGTTLLASSQRTPHQAFRMGRHAYGLQFHLEVGREQVEEWLAVPAVRQELESTPGAPGAAALLEQAAEREKRLGWLCSSVLSRLFNLL